VDVEEDAVPWADNDKDDDEQGYDEESEEGDDENDDKEDFESPANTAATTKNDKDNKNNKESRTKRPPSILTSNALPGSIQSSVSEMPDAHGFQGAQRDAMMIQSTTLLSSSMAEHSAVNRRVVGSSPT
jgi:hypothetical protein